MARTRSGKDKRSYPQAPLYVSEIPSEVPLDERAARAGLQVVLESSGVGFIGELQRHDDKPRPVVPGIAAPAIVVPGESIVDVGDAFDVMPIRVTFASQDVDESRADASHTEARAFCARALWPRLVWKRLGQRSGST